MVKKTSNQKRTRLSNLDLSMVSLVRAGDDPMASVVLAKAAPEDKNTNDKQGGRTISRNKPVGSDDDMATKKTGDADDVISKDDLPEEVVAYIEALEDHIDELAKDEDDEEEDEEETDEEEDEEEPPAPTSKGKGKKTAKATPVPADLATLLAKSDPEVAALIKAQQEEVAKASKRAEDAEKVAKAERTERRRRDFVAKAEKLPEVNTNATELGDVLRKIDDIDPKLGEQVETMLKAANEQIAKGKLFEEVGKIGGAVTLGESVDAAAKAIQTKEPNLTYEQAVTKAYEQNPALYDESIKEG